MTRYQLIFLLIFLLTLTSAWWVMLHYPRFTMCTPLVAFVLFAFIGERIEKSSHLY